MESNLLVDPMKERESFTDVFHDETAQENISQPISLPSSNDTVVESPTKVFARDSTTSSRPLKGTGQHGEFRSVEEIDPKYRCLFTFPYFNLVQSRVIEDALYSDKSLVLCAPTGSGKTVAFEMAILQLLMEIEDTQYAGDFKIIYMAPVKAVCNERLTEWYPKLTKLGLLCIEVTGDTEVDFTQLKPYKVIITTPEKWDILTRRWRDHRGLVEIIKLFLIDEVHILNDEIRGPVLETVVSRMKTIESAAQSAHRIEQLQRQYQGSEDSSSAPPRIRFVAVSATISNPEDVALWLGTNEKPAVFYKFGDECRPVRLRQVVEGYACAEGTSIFKFDIILNYKLWSIIQKYYNGKPTLIFCNTRKSVALTAETLSKEITVSFNPEQKAKLTALASTLKNKKLQMLVMSGVGCHHAGLLFEERVNIERAFRNRDLPILITTTTLAMGVNLPAHLVIIKNTQQYVNGAYQEYSISTVLQMVGRAGRPQFDTEATAVIMTRLNDKARYQSLVGGSEPLQSYLHKRIAENLNSEAALGTVTDVAQCVEWLRSTFLYVRAAKDPKRYLGLPPAAPTHLILKKIEELCVKAMNSLASSGLITMDEASCIESTEAGRLMSIFYLDVETMKNIMKIDGTENLERLLWLICESHELFDMHLRMDERRCLNLLNRNKAAATIRFPMKGKISTRQMKMNCIIQAILGCLHIPEPALNQEAMKVMKIASRVCTCLVRYVSRPELVTQQPQCFSAVLNSIVLGKCINAHLWENSPYVSKQLKGIGPTFSTLLASAGITNFMLLEESHPRDLERIMNKGPPAGNVLRKQVSLLPKYQLTVTPIDTKKITVELLLLNHDHLAENIDQLTAGDSHKSYLIVGDSENNLLLLTSFKDKVLIGVYDGRIKFEITRKLSDEHKIMIHCISSSVVGIDAQAHFIFLELVPQPPRKSDFFCSLNQNLPTRNITGVYEERKRKPNSEIDITQCKEKKKRENTLTEKLKALKENFGRTSKELKSDIDKSAETSSKLLNDLINTHGHINSGQKLHTIKDSIVEHPIVDLTNDFIHETLQDIVVIEDDYDYIDDTEIDNILNSIESEISKNDHTSNKILLTPATKNLNQNLAVPQNSKTETEIKNINTVTKDFKEPACRAGFIRDSTKRKNINIKSNFSIIDSIQKKAKYDDIEISQSNECGFSETIKCQVRNFLQRANASNLTSPGIHNSFSRIDNMELPAVHVKRNKSTEKSANSQNIEQNSNTGLNKEETKLEIKIPLNKFIYQDNEMSIKMPYIGIGQYNSEADNDINETVNGNDVETQEVKPVQEQENNEHNNIHFDEPNSSVNKHIEILQNVDEAIPDNQIVIMEKKVIPFQTSVSYENKVEQSDNTTYKHLIPYQRQLEGGREESTKNSTIPEGQISLQSRRLIYHKPIIISNFPLVDKDETTEKIFESKRKQVEIKKRPLLSYQFDTEDVILPLNDSNVLGNRPDPKLAENKMEKLKVPLNASLIPHLYEQINIENVNNDANAFSTALDLPDPLKHVTRPYPFKIYKNTADNMVKWHSPPYTTSFNPCIQNLNLVTACSDDNKETQVNKYSYTSTNFDVCTKNNADHQIRITRKLMVDVDITESVTREKINIKKMNSQDENLDVQNARRDKVKANLPNRKVENHVQSLDEINTDVELIESNNTLKCDEKVKAQFENEKLFLPKRTADDHLRSIDETNTTVELVKSNNPLKYVEKVKSQSENEQYFLPKRKVDDRVQSLGETNTINVELFESNNSLKYDEKHVDIVYDKDDKLKHCTANNSVSSILQKYSKILIKPGTNSTPTISRININGTSTARTKTNQFTPNVAKSRRPFRIRDIHTMDMPTETTIEVSRSATNKLLKPNLECLKQTMIKDNEDQPPVMEIETQHNFNISGQDSQVNEQSPIKSPISVLSLELDPIENIKDDNMFNPKALLQYFSVDSKLSDKEIIDPPLEFCDASAYSPTIPTQHVTDNLYEYDCDMLQHSTWEDENNLDNNNSDFNDTFNSSQKKVETWTLIRDDENAYTSQPISSVPWVISQRAGSSQASSVFSSNRTRLGHYKFVRKKPLRPR
ncbi:uncharacterized protein [Choristoneura fumiferana]|uniref:uncharacterized protein n=1 Tax=Choristoneura fumiferana TaxID=7141 RepID=UPI003D156E99